MCEKNISCIRYYNVFFLIETKSEKDKLMLEYFSRTIDSGTKITMNIIADWCDSHGIEYTTKFRYMAKMPMKANLWNLYSYIRFKYERKRQGIL